MFGWWETLDLALKILYCIALPATVVLVIQTVLLLLGFGESGMGVDGSDLSGLDLDMDADLPDDMPDASDLHDGGNPADFGTMRLFTLQTVIAFLTVFSWSAIVSLHTGGALWLSLLIGFLLGGLAMFLLAKLVQLSAKLAENGTQELRHALGSTATVYLPIPGAGNGYGKVTLTLQGAFTECEAITYGEEPLAVGTKVRVIDIMDQMLVVEQEKE